MNLYALLRNRERPVRCAVIGCGKFATMFLSQARRTPNLHVAAVVDLSPERARTALSTAGYDEERVGAASVDAAIAAGTTYVTDTASEVVGDNAVDVIVEATGHPVPATEHALSAIESGHHVVMVSVEADVLVGPVLAEKARRSGVVYTMAYGDQPALICELVDWAHSCGLDVVCAGKGTKYLPEYHLSTPETVWDHYGLTREYADRARLNPAMFNSFLDGTKSAIEMAAVANATGLAPPEDGLLFPPAGVDDLASVCVPRDAGGVLARSGTVEVVSSLDRSGDAVERDLRWGVYATLRAPSEYVADCFAEYGLVTDASGRFTAMHRPFHLIGLELGVSVLSAALRGEPTGQSCGFVADVVATAKRDLHEGEVLDGEGGYTVYGSLISSSASVAGDMVPLGLAGGARVRRRVAAGATVRWDDIEIEVSSQATVLRRELVRGPHAPDPVGATRTESGAR